MGVRIVYGAYDGTTMDIIVVMVTNPVWDKERDHSLVVSASVSSTPNWTGGWVVGWVGGWVDGWLGGWVVGWMGG